MLEVVTIFGGEGRHLLFGHAAQAQGAKLLASGTTLLAAAIDFVLTNEVDAGTMDRCLNEAASARALAEVYGHAARRQFAKAAEFRTLVEGPCPT